MKLIPNWKEVSIDTYSMRFLWCMAWAFVLLPELAYAILTFDIVSPYMRGWGMLVFMGLIWLGRVLNQGIAAARRERLPGMAVRVAWFTLFPLGVFTVLVGVSIGGWIGAELM